MAYREPNTIVLINKDKTKSTYNERALPYKTNDQAIAEAVCEIDRERAGEQTGLYSCYPGVDKLQGKFWRFAQTNVLYSRTAHGKSYNLMQLMNAWSNFKDKYIWYSAIPEGIFAKNNLEAKMDDLGIEFTVLADKRGVEHYHKIERSLNKGFLDDNEGVIFLNFSFEMLGRDDAARNITTLIGKSTSYIHSSEFDPNTGQYNKVSDQEYGMLKYYASLLNGRPIIYFEVSGNIDDIYTTYRFWKQANPKHKFVINIDHMGLVDQKDYQTEMDMVKEIAKTSIKLRREDCMTNLIAQMNADIVSPTRQAKPNTQHPLITDIHGSNQLGWAVDNAWCMPYRPDVEHLHRYGEHHMDTNNLVIACKVKSRSGSLGEVYLENRLDIGRFIPLTSEQITCRFNEPKKAKSKS